MFHITYYIEVMFKVKTIDTYAFYYVISDDLDVFNLVFTTTYANMQLFSGKNRWNYENRKFFEAV